MSDTNVWSFRGTPFRRMDPEGETRNWPRRLMTTVDVVADSPTAAPIRYVDVGATEHESPWQIRAGCLTTAARDALEAAYGQTGTLVTVSGRSYTALCVQADVETASGDGLHYVRLAFELVSA